MVSANASTGARLANRTASRIQQFWLDAVKLLILILENTEELKLPAKVMHSIWIALQLMRNANSHHYTAHRNALMVQLNPQPKPLFNDGDFNNAEQYLFGDKFWIPW